MCLIIHRESGSNVPNDVLDYNKHLNPDGFGIAWREAGKVLYEKFAPKEYGAFKDLLKSIDKQADVEYVAHFRRATHGPVCQEMSHPFPYEDEKDGEVLVFHNGIIDIDAPKTESDTSQFVKAVLAKMEPRWWKKAAYRFLVEQSVGWSRLLIMTEKETIRLNEKSWVKQGGIWYSTTPVPASYGKAKHKGAKDTAPKYLGSGKGSEQQYRAPWLKPDTGGDDGFVSIDTVTDASTGSTGKDWYSQGHIIEAVTALDGNEDQQGIAVCTVCRTDGDFYLIGGQVFLDIPHLDIPDDDEDEESDDAVMRAVYAA